jgi:tetratricopeptide (TPR) repeat protein
VTPRRRCSPPPRWSINAGLVREADELDRFIFAHALVRETLYESQSASRRVRLHHRIARALEDLGPLTTPAELAHHYVESRHLDRDGKAVDYCEQAAVAALAALAYEEAKEHYAAALERLHNNAPRRCELLIGLGTAAARMSDPDAAGAFMEAAAIATREGLPEPLARAAMGRSGIRASAGTVEYEAIELLESALEAQGTDEGPLVAQLLARLANALHFSGASERVDQLSARALELARRSGDRLALVYALESRHAALMGGGDLGERLQLATELHDLAERAGEPELKMLGLHWRTWDLLEMGDVDLARVESARLAALAEELRQPIYRYHAARWQVIWAMIADRVDEAPALIARSHALGNRARAGEADVEAAGQQFALAYRAGVLGNYAMMLDAEYRANPQVVVNLPALALAHLQAGNREAGVALFEGIARNDFAGVPRDMLWTGAMAVLSQVCALIGDEARARTLYHILLPLRDRNVMIGTAVCWGSAERFLGLLATVLRDFDAAAAHFETAIARNADGGIDSMFEMVRREYADMLELRGGPGDAEHAARLRAETLATAPPSIAATQVEPKRAL